MISGGRHEIFDTYWFNIADKVKFKDSQPYLKNMLAELGLSWSNLAFSASTVPGDSVIARILEKFPKLEKYYHSTENVPTICSYTESWFSGELFSDKSDYDDVFTLFSKIPRPLNIPFGHILLNGVNWLGEESSSPVPNYNLECADFSMLSNVLYCYIREIIRARWDKV